MIRFSIIVLSLVVATKAMAIPSDSKTDGSEKDYNKALQDSSLGIYKDVKGRPVKKPSQKVCESYKTFYSEYTDKYGRGKGALIWNIVYIRRGCA